MVPGATDPADGLPPNRAADGLLVGLLHLTAVAGALDGSLVAFDEVENHLHPHAIRSLIAAMRQQAEERNLTIVLTTHSPVVLNQFVCAPEQVYVLDRADPDLPMPARMSDLHNEDWLAQSKLGTLYERLAFAAPEVATDVGMSKTVAILPTGRTEWHGLRGRADRIFPDHTFYSLPTTQEVASARRLPLTLASQAPNSPRSLRRSPRVRARVGGARGPRRSAIASARLPTWCSSSKTSSSSTPISLAAWCR
ncbi:MAG: ATP-binding protein [Proteobacteria bacterium]|nr:ATP-binding protein [Pseudomonadota bacterium]